MRGFFIPRSSFNSYDESDLLLNLWFFLDSFPIHLKEFSIDVAISCMRLLIFILLFWLLKILSAVKGDAVIKFLVFEAFFGLLCLSFGNVFFGFVKFWESFTLCVQVFRGDWFGLNLFVVLGLLVDHHVLWFDLNFRRFICWRAFALWVNRALV